MTPAEARELGIKAMIERWQKCIAERDKLQAENAELLTLLRRLQPSAPTRELFDAVTNAHLRWADEKHNA